VPTSLDKHAVPALTQAVSMQLVSNQQAGRYDGQHKEGLIVIAYSLLLT
jgi:hypothetical protein